MPSKAAGGPTEKQFQAQVIELATLRGWRLVHFRKVLVRRPSGSCYWATPFEGAAGFFDLALVRAGVMLLVELKTLAGRQGPEQRAWAEDCRAVGGGVRVCLWRPTPECWKEIEEVLR